MEGSEIGRGQMEPLDAAVDHVRGAPAGRLIVEYGDYECPYSRKAFREIEHVEHRLPEDADTRDANTVERYLH